MDLSRLSRSHFAGLMAAVCLLSGFVGTLGAGAWQRHVSAQRTPPQLRKLQAALGRRLARGVRDPQLRIQLQYLYDHPEYAFITFEVDKVRRHVRNLGSSVEEAGAERESSDDFDAGLEDFDTTADQLTEDLENIE